MKTRWNKVLRDLRQNKTRSILAVLAISLGVAGFGSVLSTYSILTRELNEGYLETNPASATIWTDKIDEQTTAQLSSLTDIKRVEERRSISARVRIAPNEWRNAVLFIIKDYKNIRVSILKPQAGKWPPDDGEILVERDALGVARAKVGDTLLLKTSQGPERTLRLTGSVHDVGQAQARMEQLVYGYITLNTLKQLGEDPFLDEWKIEVAGEKFREEHVRSVIAAVKTFLEKKGKPVERIEIPKPGKHPHADLMGMLLLFKASFGLFALLLSGVLVVNLISALMAGQIRQIGIMKSIGARRSQVMGIYLTSVFLLSALALMISIPLAVVGGRSLATFMSRFLNFDIRSYSVDGWVFLLEILAGLLIPLLASLYPVIKGSRITVREAISDYGIEQKVFGNRRTDRLIARFGGMARPLLLSIRNTFRRRGRFILIVATLAAGGTIFIAAWNVRASLIHTVDVMLSSFRYDLSLSFNEPLPIAELERVVRSTAGVKHVESWVTAEVVLVKADGSQSNPVALVAAPWNSKAIVFHMLEGRAIRPEDRDVIVVNQALAASSPEWKIGNTVTLRMGDRTKKWKIVGIARQPLAGSSAYAGYDDLAEFSGQVGLARNVRVITAEHDKSSIDAVKRDLEKNLASAGFRAVRNVSMAERRIIIDEHNSVIYTFLIVMALLIVVVGGLGLMTVMSISVLERRREIGVMRAMGATRKQVLWIILGEGSLLAMMSWIIAVFLSAFISESLGNFAAGRILRTKLEFTADPYGIAIWLFVVLLFGATASFLPAWKASRMTVRELVEYE